MIPSTFDQTTPVVEYKLEHGKDDVKILGMTEYGWSVWTRFMRTGPVKNMPWK